MEYWAGFWGMLEVSTNLKLILWLSAISQACVSSKDTKIPKTGNIVDLVVPRSSWDLCQSETHRQKSLLLIPLCQLCGWQSSLKHLKEQMWVRKKSFHMDQASRCRQDHILKKGFWEILIPKAAPAHEHGARWNRAWVPAIFLLSSSLKPPSTIFFHMLYRWSQGRKTKTKNTYNLS